MDKEQDAIRVQREDEERLWYLKLINHRIDTFFRATEDLILSNKQTLRNIEEARRRVQMRRPEKTNATRIDSEEEDTRYQYAGVGHLIRTILEYFLLLAAYNEKKKLQELKDRKKGNPKQADQEESPDLVYLADENIEFIAKEIVFESDAEFSSKPHFREMNLEERERWQTEVYGERHYSGSTQEERQTGSVGSSLPFEQVVPEAPKTENPSRPIPAQEPPDIGAVGSPLPFEQSIEAPTAPVQPRASEQTPEQPETKRQAAPETSTPEAKSAPEMESEDTQSGAKEHPRAKEDQKPNFVPRNFSGERPVPEGEVDGNSPQSSADPPASSAKPTTPLNSGVPFEPIATDVPSKHEEAPAKPVPEKQPDTSATKSLKRDETTPFSRFDFGAKPLHLEEKLEKKKMETPTEIVPFDRFQFRSIEPLTGKSSKTLEKRDHKATDKVSGKKGNDYASKSKDDSFHGVPPPMIIGDIGKKKWLESPAVVSPSHNYRGDFGVTGDLV
jgi:hypothetical protein